MAIAYADYTFPEQLSVVVEGALIAYSNDALHALAQNAMVLAVGDASHFSEQLAELETSRVPLS